MKRDNFFFISILLIKHQAPVFQHSQCLNIKKNHAVHNIHTVD